MSPDFPPAFQLLLNLLRSALGTETFEATASTQGVDEGEFLEWTRRHRVGSFLHHRLPSSVRASLPLGIREGLRLQAAQNRHHDLRRVAETVRLIRIFRRAGVDVLHVKGAPMARELYGDFGIRHAGDIDLWVRRSDVALAHQLAISAGYRRHRPDHSLTPAQYDLCLRLSREFEYLSPDALLRVEIMWDLGENVDEKEVWTSHETVSLGGENVDVLPPQVCWIYLFQHGAHHAWCRLFWLVDVATLLRRHDVDWADLWSRAKRFRAERQFLQGLSLSRSLLGLRIPPELDQETSSLQISRLASDACSAMRLPVERLPGFASWIRTTAYRLRLQRGWKQKWRLDIFRPQHAIVESWRRVSLPDSLLFLHYPLVPVFWLRRRLQKDHQLSS